MTNIDTSKYAVGDIINTSGTKAASANNVLDKDAFLKLLVAQLKYQSPDSPADSSAFMQQSAQFSQLEAIQNMAKEQTALLNAQQAVMATGMLGQKVTASGANGGADITGVVTGVKLGSAGPILKVGDMEVPIASVKEVDRAS